MNALGRTTIACLLLTAGCAVEDMKEQTVVILHGMGRTRASVLILEKRFARAGYRTLNFPYSEARRSMDDISNDLLEYIEQKVETPRYHLVAHSLGNIIIRNAFRKKFPPGLGRIVMLAPPNRPAELAGKLKDNLLYRLITGDSGRKLADPEFYTDLPIPTVPFGVIAGDRALIPAHDRPSDGVVTVESTKLDGMADWVRVHHTHTFIMNSKDTFELCRRFLETGRF